jgi:glycosyltransferase involved in cell wall biosynthesis
MPSISIALATYNGERYIAAQLDSIRRQSSTPNELIVCDDGSSDNTINLVQEFAENASFHTQIIQNPLRLGYRTNFMQAAAACTSELIAFCDQDDIWAPDKLATMRYAFEDPKVLLAYHNATLIDDRGLILGTTFRQRVPKIFEPLAIYPWLIIPGFAQVVRQSLLRFTPLHAGSIDPYALGEPMPHDHWYLFWASVLGRIVYIPNTVAQYRQHDANESGWPAHYLAYALDHLRNAEQYVAGNALGVTNRLDLLQRCHNLLQDDEQARVDAAIRYYEVLEANSELRTKVYRNKTLTDRMRALSALTRNGAYTGSRSDAWGFDALLLDALVGVAFNRLGRSR